MNVNGGVGNSIPLNLHLEHFNCVFKDNINTFEHTSTVLLGKKNIFPGFPDTLILTYNQQM